MAEDTKQAVPAKGAPTAAPEKPKALEATPTTPEWKEYELKQRLNPKFLWRNKTYIAEKLTAIDLATLAADKAFKAIVVKGAKPTGE